MLWGQFGRAWGAGQRGLDASCWEFWGESQALAGGMYWKDWPQAAEGSVIIGSRGQAWVRGAEV